jgi:hypothetical protein
MCIEPEIDNFKVLAEVCVQLLNASLILAVQPGDTRKRISILRLHSVVAQLQPSLVATVRFVLPKVQQGLECFLDLLFVQATPVVTLQRVNDLHIWVTKLCSLYG